MERICKQGAFENVHACWLGAGIVLVQDFRRLFSKDRGYVQIIANAKPAAQSFMLEKLFSFPIDEPGMMRELKKLDQK